jgi:hypothetical protein
MLILRQNLHASSGKRRTCGREVQSREIVRKIKELSVYYHCQIKMTVLFAIAEKLANIQCRLRVNVARRKTAAKC